MRIVPEGQAEDLLWALAATGAATAASTTERRVRFAIARHPPSAPVFGRRLSLNGRHHTPFAARTKRTPGACGTAPLLSRHAIARLPQPAPVRRSAARN